MPRTIYQFKIIPVQFGGQPKCFAVEIDLPPLEDGIRRARRAILPAGVAPIRSRVAAFVVDVVGGQLCCMSRLLRSGEWSAYEPGAWMRPERTTRATEKEFRAAC